MKLKKISIATGLEKEYQVWLYFMTVKVLTASALEETQHYQLVSEVKKQCLSSIYWVFALQVGLYVVSVCWLEKEIVLRQSLCRCIDQADPEPTIPLPRPSACCVTWILSANLEGIIIALHFAEGLQNSAAPSEKGACLDESLAEAEASIWT